MTEDEKILREYVWNSNLYGPLMKGNISNPSFNEEGRQQSIRLIKNMVIEGNDDLIEKLLQIENWRSKLLAGCLIGFKKREKYLSQIGENLVKGCGGVSGYCYAFARFSNEESIHYLIKYLDKYLAFDKFPNENFQDWAFSSLRWIDKINNTNISDSYLKKDGLWTRFVNFEIKTKKAWKLSDYARWGDLEAMDNRFEAMMYFYRDNFEER